ncbi:MAG: hypothetical protein ABJF11_18445 [Reichenbachiella sp.]|uniref:glycoside hydrolase family 113 n=1 Tax=Reichenbachiella sp. TaxID=2184521 RepID=UPI0032637AB0
MILRVVIIFCLLACSGPQEKKPSKINGVCLVAPSFEIKKEYYEPILATKANWVAVIPYAFCSPQKPKVTFDHPNQWWGERTEGIRQAVVLAKESGLKIMIKPHLWVLGQGWAGDLNFDNASDLNAWMQSYSRYILHFSHLAEELNVELFSIGTEVRWIVKSNPDFWIKLIKEIRTIYSGEITYSSNWDNYQNVTFWDDLDYIGIDAYFPSADTETPAVQELIDNNQLIKSELEKFSVVHLKKVLFTEFGFKSVDFCAAGHWVSHDKKININLTAQANAYDALFKTYWNQDWFAGGFAWKWHYKHSTTGGDQNSEFTPQNKLAEKILKNRYSLDR